MPPNWPVWTCTASARSPAPGRSSGRRPSRSALICASRCWRATRRPSPGWSAGCASAAAGFPPSAAVWLHLWQTDGHGHRRLGGRTLCCKAPRAARRMSCSRLRPTAHGSTSGTLPTKRLSVAAPASRLRRRGPIVFRVAAPPRHPYHVTLFPRPHRPLADAVAAARFRSLQAAIP